MIYISLFSPKLNARSYFIKKLLHRFCGSIINLKLRPIISMYVKIYYLSFEQRSIITPELLQTYIYKADQFDYIDDFINNGYFGRIYCLNNKKYSFVGGLTLRDVLDMRIKNSKPYHEEEILDFISAVSFTLGYFETEFGIYHGQLNLQNFVLVYNDEKHCFQYAIIEIGQFYWYDHLTGCTTFMKGIISNDEAWFISPEIIYNYSYREHQAKHKHINSEHLEHQIEHNPFKSDAFSLGLICFEMMTLGRMTQELSNEIKAHQGDMRKTINAWISKNLVELKNQFPISMQYVLDLVNSKLSQRPFLSVVSKNFTKYHYEEESLKEQGFSLNSVEERYQKLLNQHFHPKLTNEKVVKIFDQNQETGHLSLPGQQIQFSDYLNQSLHSLKVFLRLKMFDNLNDTFLRVENTLRNQYFLKLPYQEANEDIFDQICQYFKTQFYVIVVDPSKLNLMEKFLEFLLLKCQTLVQQFDFFNVGRSINQMIESLTDFGFQLDQLISNNKSSLENRAGVLNNEQFHEIEQQRQEVFALVNQEPNYLKLIKKYRIKLNFRINNFRIILATLFFCQKSYELALENLNEAILSQSKALMQLKKYFASKTEELVTEKTKREIKMYCISNSYFYQLMKLINMLRLKMLNLQDSFREQEFHTAAEEYRHFSSLIAQKEKSQPILPQYTGENQDIQQLILSLDFQGVSKHHLEMYVSFQHSQQVNATFSIVRNQIAHYQLKKAKVLSDSLKSMLQNKCIFQWMDNIIVNSSFAELYLAENDETSFNTQINYFFNELEILYFQIQFFGPGELLILKYILARILFYTSHLLYYLPIQKSEPLISGFITLLKQEHQLAESTVFYDLLMIKLIHMSLATKQYNPIYHQATNQQISYDNELNPRISETSEIRTLQFHYLKIFEIFNLQQLDEDNETAVKPEQQTWLHLDTLHEYKIELLTGLIYSFSLVHYENTNLDEFKKRVSENSYFIIQTFIQEHLKYKNQLSLVQIEMLCLKAKLLVDQESLDKSPKVIAEILNAMNFECSHDLKQIVYCLAFYYLLKSTYFSGLTLKDMIKSSVFQQFYQMKKLAVSMMLEIIAFFLYDIQQHNFSYYLIDMFIKLQRLQAPVLQHSHANLQRNLSLLKCRILYFEKKNKELSISVLKSLYQPSESLSYLLAANKLDSLDISLITKKIFQAQLNFDVETDEIITNLQISIKLIQQYLANAQFNKAESICLDTEQKICQLFMEIIKQGTQKWLGRKLLINQHLISTTLNNVLKVFKILDQSTFRIETEIFFCLDTKIIPAFLDSNLEAQIPSLLVLRQLFYLIQLLFFITKSMMGDTDQILNIYKLIEKIYPNEKLLFSVMMEQVLIKYNVSMSEFEKAINYQQIIQRKITEIQIKNTLLLQNEHSCQKWVHPNPQFKNFDNFEFKEHLSYQEKLNEITILPFFDVDKILIESMLGYFEANINQDAKLVKIVEPIMKWQEIIQSQFGSKSLYFAHIQRLIAQMYIQIVTSNQISMLRHELSKDSKSKIEFLKRQKKIVSLQYLESLVNGQSTPLTKKVAK